RRARAAIGRAGWGDSADAPARQRKRRPATTRVRYIKGGAKRAEGSGMGAADRAWVEPGQPAPDRSLRLLRLLPRSAVASNQADRAEDAIARVLGDLCELLDWQTGHAWLRVEDGSEALEPTGVWYHSTPERFAALCEATPRGRIEPAPVLRPHLFS